MTHLLSSNLIHALMASIVQNFEKSLCGIMISQFKSKGKFQQ